MNLNNIHQSFDQSKRIPTTTNLVMNPSNVLNSTTAFEQQNKNPTTHVPLRSSVHGGLKRPLSKQISLRNRLQNVHNVESFSPYDENFGFEARYDDHESFDALINPNNPHYQAKLMKKQNNKSKKVKNIGNNDINSFNDLFHSSDEDINISAEDLFQNEFDIDFLSPTLKKSQVSPKPLKNGNNRSTFMPIDTKNIDGDEKLTENQSKNGKCQKLQCVPLPLHSTHMDEISSSTYLVLPLQEKIAQIVVNLIDFCMFFNLFNNNQTDGLNNESNVQHTDDLYTYHMAIDQYLSKTNHLPQHSNTRILTTTANAFIINNINLICVSTLQLISNAKVNVNKIIPILITLNPSFTTDLVTILREYVPINYNLSKQNKKFAQNTSNPKLPKEISFPHYPISVYMINASVLSGIFSNLYQVHQIFTETPIEPINTPSIIDLFIKAPKIDRIFDKYTELSQLRETLHENAKKLQFFTTVYYKLYYMLYSLGFDAPLSIMTLFLMMFLPQNTPTPPKPSQKKGQKIPCDSEIFSFDVMLAIIPPRAIDHMLDALITNFIAPHFQQSEQNNPTFDPNVLFYLLLLIHLTSHPSFKIHISPHLSTHTTSCLQQLEGWINAYHNTHSQPPNDNDTIKNKDIILKYNKITLNSLFSRDFNPNTSQNDTNTTDLIDIPQIMPFFSSAQLIALTTQFLPPTLTTYRTMSHPKVITNEMTYLLNYNQEIVIKQQFLAENVNIGNKYDLPGLPHYDHIQDLPLSLFTPANSALSDVNYSMFYPKTTQSVIINCVASKITQELVESSEVIADITLETLQPQDLLETLFPDDIFFSHNQQDPPNNQGIAENAMNNNNNFYSMTESIQPLFNILHSIIYTVLNELQLALFGQLLIGCVLPLYTCQLGHYMLYQEIIHHNNDQNDAFLHGSEEILTWFNEYNEMYQNYYPTTSNIHHIIPKYPCDGRFFDIQTDKNNKQQIYENTKFFYPKQRNSMIDSNRLDYCLPADMLNRKNMVYFINLHSYFNQYENMYDNINANGLLFSNNMDQNFKMQNSVSITRQNENITNYFVIYKLVYFLMTQYNDIYHYTTARVTSPYYELLDHHAQLQTLMVNHNKRVKLNAKDHSLYLGIDSTFHKLPRNLPPITTRVNVKQRIYNKLVSLATSLILPSFFQSQQHRNIISLQKIHNDTGINLGSDNILLTNDVDNNDLMLNSIYVDLEHIPWFRHNIMFQQTIYDMNIGINDNIMQFTTSFKSFSHDCEQSLNSNNITNFGLLLTQHIIPTSSHPSKQSSAQKALLLPYKHYLLFLSGFVETCCLLKACVPETSTLTTSLLSVSSSQELGLFPNASMFMGYTDEYNDLINRSITRHLESDFTTNIRKIQKIKYSNNDNNEGKLTTDGISLYNIYNIPHFPLLFTETLTYRNFARMSPSTSLKEAPNDISMNNNFPNSDDTTPTTSPTDTNTVKTSNPIMPQPNVISIQHFSTQQYRLIVSSITENHWSMLLLLTLFNPLHIMAMAPSFYDGGVNMAEATRLSSELAKMATIQHELFEGAPIPAKDAPQCPKCSGISQIYVLTHATASTSSKTDIYGSDDAMTEQFSCKQCQHVWLVKY